MFITKPNQLLVLQQILSKDRESYQFIKFFSS